MPKDCASRISLRSIRATLAVRMVPPTRTSVQRENKRKCDQRCLQEPYDHITHPCCDCPELLRSRRM